MSGVVGVAMSTVVAAASLAGAVWAGWSLGAQAWCRGLRRGVTFRGPAGAGALAFTFDDGPDPEVTPKVAAILEAAGFRGTFFVLSRRLQRYGSLARGLVQSGHEVALHGLTHRHLWVQGPVATLRQMQLGVQAIEEATGSRPRFYRPPWGHFNAATGWAARRMGLQVVLWSSAPADYRRALSPHRLQQEIVRGMEPGAIIDLHDRGPLSARGALLESLAAAVQHARWLGLAGVTLSQLLGQPAPNGPRAGAP